MQALKFSKHSFLPAGHGSNASAASTRMPTAPLAARSVRLVAKSATVDQSGAPLAQPANPNPTADAAAPSAAVVNASGQADVPWQLGFQCNERTLEWDQGAQRQLVKIYAAGKLGVEMEELEARIEDLRALLPDMAGKVEVIKGDVLVGLLQDVHGLAWKLLGLKEVMPNSNVSSLVARYPALVLQYSKEEVAARLSVMREQLPGVRVEALLEVEPNLLAADVSAVLAEIHRLLPDADAVKVLVSDPLAALDMAQAGLPSSIEATGELPSSMEATGELPSSIEATGELPSSIEATGELPSSIEATGELPSSIEATGGLPSSIEATEGLPSSIEANRELPSSIETTEGLPSSIEANRELPSSIEATGGLPSPIEATGELPSPIEATRGLPSSIETTGGLPSSIEATGELPSSIEATGGLL